MGNLAGSLLDGILSWLAVQIGRVLDWLWSILTAVLFTSPDVTGLPQVRHASGLALGVVNAAMVLMVVVVGGLHMASGGSDRSQYTLRSLGPRFAASIVAANLASGIVSGAINAANAVTAALTGTDFTTSQTLAQIRAQLASIAFHPGNLLLTLVLQDCLTFALAALLISWMVRIGQLLLLAAVAPLAMAAHTFPATQVAAEAWWRTLGAALVTQILQAVALTLAWTTLVSPDASLPVLLGFPTDPGGTINLALAAFTTAQVALIPRYVRRLFAAGRGGRSSTVSALLRMVVVQQVLRGVGLRGRSGGARAGASGTGAAVGRTAAARDTVHYHTEGERQTTNLYGANAIQHTHERGAHQYQHHHVHEALPPRPTARATWRPSRAGTPASLTLRRTR